MRKELFPFIALNNILTDQIIDIHGDGEQTRQYIYIDDLVSGIKSITENQKIVNKAIVNLCGEEETSVREVIATAEKATGLIARTRNVSDRYSQIYRENIMTGLASAVLGWEAKTTFVCGMFDLLLKDKRFEKYINNNTISI